MDSLRGAHLIARAEAQYTSSEYPQSGPDPIALLNTVKIPTKCLVNARLGLGDEALVAHAGEIVARAPAVVIDAGADEIADLVAGKGVELAEIAEDRIPDWGIRIHRAPREKKGCEASPYELGELRT